MHLAGWRHPLAEQGADGADRFLTLVVPELQRRGLFRRDYAGSTLRDHLGLDYPANRFSASIAAE